MPASREWPLRFGAGRLLISKGLKFGERFAVGRAVGNAFGGDDVRERSHVDGAAGDDAGLGPADASVTAIRTCAAPITADRANPTAIAIQVARRVRSLSSSLRMRTVMTVPADR